MLAWQAFGLHNTRNYIQNLGFSTMQGLPQIISLVPQTGLQFIDIRFGLDRLPRAPRSFWEQPLPPGADPASAGLVNLRRLTDSGDGALTEDFPPTLN